MGLTIMGPGLNADVVKQLIYDAYGELHDFKYIIRDPVNNVPTEWFWENIGGRYGKIPYYYLFETENDATLFKLTWDWY
jgi:hypothetical protein